MSNNEQTSFFMYMKSEFENYNTHPIKFTHNEATDKQKKMLKSLLQMWAISGKLNIVNQKYVYPCQRNKRAQFLECSPKGFFPEITLTV